MTAPPGPCPHCGRPIGVEYVDVEPGKCQLWRAFNESGFRDVNPRTFAECFGLTSRRIRELEAKVADLETSKRAAQRALARQHAASGSRPEPEKPQDMFPDDARIT